MGPGEWLVAKLEGGEGGALDLVGTRCASLGCRLSYSLSKLFLLLGVFFLVLLLSLFFGMGRGWRARCTLRTYPAAAVCLGLVGLSFVVFTERGKIHS